MLLLETSDAGISEHLATDLADVEGRFAAELTSDLACVNQLVKHLERYRGKMIRPALMLVSAMSRAFDSLYRSFLVMSSKTVHPSTYSMTK